MSVKGLALALLVHMAAANNCNSYGNCADCLSPENGLDCGWCSPDPVTFGNGTKGFQCMDHASTGWICNNFYMHDGCVPGYICDSSSGQCVMTDAGEGDTQANCEATCTENPPPDDQYTCDVETFTCVLDTTGTSATSCSDACADETPSQIVGLWRGLSVNTGFDKEEHVFNFTESSVTWGVYGEPVQGAADVATVSPQVLRLTFTSPPELVGSFYYASYTNPGYPTGPETSSMSLAVQGEGTKQAPPANVVDAMGDPLFDVYVMHKCNSWGAAGCDFSPAFQATAKKKSAKKARKLEDSCIGYTDCDACLGDASGVCGWCDGVVRDTDGNAVCGEDGNGCCGGNDGFSTCDVAFRKVCPVTCDYTDWENPTCRAATTPEYLSGSNIFDNCDDMPWCTNTIYQYCDEATANCKTLYTEEDCEADPNCDVSNPAGCDSDSCKVTNYVYCDAVLGCQSTTSKDECAANPDCDENDPTATCNPTMCAAQVYYTCEADDFTCVVHTGAVPSGVVAFNNTDACKAACVDLDVSGAWRALRIDQGFQAGEWDFALGSESIVFKSQETGESFKGTYTIGAAVPGSPYKAAVFTVTLDSGEVLAGVISNDRDEDTAKGPVTKFMYIGLPLSAGFVGTFDDAMGENFQEFVLIACLDDGIQQGCDFSSASP